MQQASSSADQPQHKSLVEAGVRNTLESRTRGDGGAWDGPISGHETGRPRRASSILPDRSVGGVLRVGLSKTFCSNANCLVPRRVW